MGRQFTTARAEFIDDKMFELPADLMFKTINQTDDSGFIKFGSRVDVYLPVDTNVVVSLNQVVQGGVSILATI